MISSGEQNGESRTVTTLAVETNKVGTLRREVLSPAIVNLKDEYRREAAEAVNLFVGRPFQAVVAANATDVYALKRASDILSQPRRAY